MFVRKIIAGSVVLFLAVAPSIGAAQFLGNFDAINNTGKTAHGFQIDLEGLTSADISDTFGGEGRGFPTTVERYGAPIIVPYASGVSVIYQATYDSLSRNWKAPGGTVFTPDVPSVGTPSAATFQTPGDNCWSGGGIGYSAGTPCDHFGVGVRQNPTKTTYSWLTEDSPGAGTTSKTVVNLPAPSWVVIPQPAAPPIVRAIIEAPPLPEVQPPEPQFGTAIWAKVFTTELQQPEGLEGLMLGNLKNNHNLKLEKRPDGTEIEWQLLQADPGNPLAGRLKLGGEVGAAAVVRRYEFYDFAGEYKAVDHEALFADGFGDSKPNPGPNGFGMPGSDVGAFLGAQNAQAALAVPEPETYAMMLAGLGLVISIARRRNNPRLL